MRKKLIIGIILIVLLVFNATPTYAADIMDTAKNWLELGRTGKDVPKRTDWSDLNGLVNILWGAGIFITLITGTILGIKYMFASLEEQANIKESAKPYIIGTIIIMGALSIWKFLIVFLDTAV